MRELLKNRPLAFGLVLVSLVAALGLIGQFWVDIDKAQPATVTESLPPSREHPLGTEASGRDVLAVMVAATPQTLKIGLLAGTVAIVVGTALGFISGYYRGPVDVVIRSSADVMLTIPALALLIVIASSVRGLTVEQMALIVAALAWPWPTRVIRSQVLIMRERAYVQVAKLSGMSDPEIIVREMVPNLAPFLAANYVGAVAGAVLATLGLEVLGLGPPNTPTLGITFYYVIEFAGLFRGMWWWWCPPIVIVVTMITGLFLMSMGLDQIANPRLRRRV